MIYNTNVKILKRKDVNMKYKYKKWLLGFGFDSDDRHVRITKGDNFHLRGGSKDTHYNMREKIVKFNEAIKKKGKSLEDATDEEIEDIAHKVGFKHFRRFRN